MRPTDHTKIIRWLRIGLPGAGALLLGLLFTYWQFFRPAGTIDMEEVAAADGSGESISGGRIEFVADDKTALSISTETVRQGDLADGTLEAANIALEMRSQDGSVFNANAERGSVDVRGKAILLSGNARMTAFGGYNVLSDSFLVSQEGDKSPKETRLSSLGEVFLQFPGGIGAAGGVRVRKGPRDPGGELGTFLEFQEDVIVIYDSPFTN